MRRNDVDPMLVRPSFLPPPTLPPGAGAWIFATDAGPDQVGCHGLLLRDMAQSLQTLYFRQWCLMHQIQLSIKAHLSLCGSHFSDVATVCNTWRAIQNACRIHNLWVQKFPNQSTVVKRIPTRCIAQRWGAIHNSEAFILEGGYVRCSTVLPIALTPHSQPSSKQTPKLLPIAADVGPWPPKAHGAPPPQHGRATQKIQSASIDNP